MRRNEQFTVDRSAQLEMSIAAGRVHVIEGEEHIVKVSIEARNTDVFELYQIGDTITVREESGQRSRNRGVRVMVEAPPGFDLTITTRSADVEAWGRAGVVRAKSASGDVEVARAERVEVATASGRVRIGVIAGDVDCQTASGDVSLESSEGHLDASTASGDVDAIYVGDDVTIGTASGNVEVGRCDGDGVQIKTLSGNIRLGLPTGIRVDPDIATMSGKITLPDPSTDAEPAERRAVQVRLSSMSGNIRVDRSDLTAPPPERDLRP